MLAIEIAAYSGSSPGSTESLAINQSFEVEGLVIRVVGPVLSAKVLQSSCVLLYIFHTLP